MSLLSRIRDRYLVAPVAKQITESLQSIEVTKADQPSIFSVPLSFNSATASYNKQMGSGGVDWQILRSLSINHETTRSAINIRKRQITQLGYDVVDIDDDADPEQNLAQRQEIRNFITNIGGPGMRFRSLLDRMIEDVLVLDALVLYKQRTRGSQLLRVVPIDGATIKLRVDSSGARPLPPDIAFEQWIKGSKVAEFTTDEMIYEMLNPANNRAYGLSPIESLLISIDSSMRAMLYNLNYLSDNNVPQGFLAMPDGWSPDQIKQYKEFFDAMVSGSKATSKVYPIPSGTTYQAVSKPSDYSFQELFDYLDRKVAVMFDLTPQELGLNLKQYKENADSQDKIQIRKGIKPLANFIQEIFTDIIRNELGYGQFCFKFTGLEGRFDRDDLRELIPLGVIGIDEARNDRGLKKVGLNNVIIAGNAITPVEQVEDLANTKLETAQAQTEAVKNPPITPAASTVPSKTKKVEKKGQNLTFTFVESHPTFKKFKRAVKAGLRNQIEPFTSEELISKVTSTQKVDVPAGLQKAVQDQTLSINIVGLSDYLGWAAKQGGQKAYDTLNLGTTWQPSPEFQDSLYDRENYLIDSLDSTSTDWVVNQIAQGKEAGLTNDEIAQNISDELDGVTSYRAEMIVNTEVANAMQSAELGVYRDQNIEEKVWVTSEDDRVCPICEPLDGEVQKVDEAFSDGDDAPPAHPDCRCYINPVIGSVDDLTFD